MHHMVHKAHTCWVAANLIIGHLVNAGNKRHGTAGHSQGRGISPQAADVQMSGVRNPFQGGS